jgi:hypothetical protein
MRPLPECIACFLAVSAVVAVVNSMIASDRPARIARDALRFSVMIVLGIAVLSAIVFGLEWMFLPR